MTLKVNLPKAIIKPAKPEQPYDYAAKFRNMRQQAETTDGQYFEGMKKPAKGFEKFDDIDTDGSGDLSFEEIMAQRERALSVLKAIQVAHSVLPITQLAAYIANKFNDLGIMKGPHFMTHSELCTKIKNESHLNEQLWADYKAGKKPNMLRKQPGETQTLPKPQKVNGETLKKINTKA